MSKKVFDSIAGEYREKSELSEERERQLERDANRGSRV